MRVAVARWIFKHLAADPKEYCSIPGSECEMRFGELDGGEPMFLATTYNNDGFEVWISYAREGRWLTHFRANEARRLAWFILWDWWAVATWFGLKRRLWYWALRATMDADKERWAKRGQHLQS